MRFSLDIIKIVYQKLQFPKIKLIRNFLCIDRLFNSFVTNLIIETNLKQTNDYC